MPLAAEEVGQQLSDGSAPPVTPSAGLTPSRRQAWLFTAILLANVALAYIATWGSDLLERWLPDPWDDMCSMAMIGQLIGQAYLAALWLALGGLPAALRFTLVAAVVTAGSLAAARGLDGDFEDCLLIVGLAGMLVLAAQVLLAPIRWLSGCRIDFDPRYYAHESARRWQLTLGNLLSLMLLAALPIAVFRWLMLLREPDVDELALIGLLLLAAALAVSAPCTWLVLDAHRRRWSWLVVLVGIAVSGICTQLLLEGGRLDWDDLPWYLGSPLGMAGIVLANLVLLRTQGLQLIVIRKPGSAYQSEA